MKVQPTSTSRQNRRSHAPRAVVLACAASLLTACGTKKVQVAGPTPSAEIPASDPGVRGSQNGMEMMCWGVSTRSRALAELLAPYIEDTFGLDSRTRALWQSNGLRLVLVPLDRLDSIRQLLPQSGGVQRQWLGQVGLWTDIIHGTPWHDLQPVAMDNGRLSLGPGKVRILMRCWTMPVPGNDAADAPHAAMRAELLLQHQEPPRVDAAALYTRPTSVTDPLDEGLVFRRLAASITLPPDRALLIIPESPQLDWRAMAQIPEDQEQLALAETRAPRNAPPQDDGVGVGQVLRERAARRDQTEPSPESILPGPPDPGLDFSRSLGELLLTPSRVRLDNVSDRSTLRSIVVLVPRIPERFSIDPQVTQASPSQAPPAK